MYVYIDVDTYVYIIILLRIIKRRIEYIRTYNIFIKINSIKNKQNSLNINYVTYNNIKIIIRKLIK